MREKITLNYDWKFIHQDNEEFSHPAYDDSNWEIVDIPHTMNSISINYNDDRSFSTVGWYRKHLKGEMFDFTRRNVIECEGVATRASVFINGIPYMVHDGGFTPFLIEIPSEIIKNGEDITLCLRVDATETLPIAPYGGVIDYVIPPGIYREVYLYHTHNDYIKDVFTYSKKGNIDQREIFLEVSLTIDENILDEYEIEQLIINSSQATVHSSTFQVQSRLMNYRYEVEHLTLWSLDNPTLYKIQTTLKKRGKDVDRVEYSFGFRDAEFTKEGFFLNGERVTLVGLNRHQQFPHLGFAMPKRGQQSDADFLKYTLALNIVRTAHYPQSRHFLDRCDEIGLLVFTEIPGWQHIEKDKEWRKGVITQLTELIKKDRNHPSVVLWGVRINESLDDDELYVQTNKVAHFFDPSRQTGGVRNIASSHLLEDVYTYNDFSQPGLSKPSTITKLKHAPYLVSEHTGHMYPVQRSEGYEKQTQLALFHAHKLEALYKNQRICGLIGWCMSDYLTHREFGPSDNVCYHGVSDQYRIPKLVASVYSSQQQNTPVLTTSSNLSLGSYPAHSIPPFYIFTNCESVRLYHNNEYVGEYFPSNREFSHLPHPPIIIKDLIGKRLDKELIFSKREKKIVKKILLSMNTHQMNLTLMNKLLMFSIMKRTKMEYKDALRLVETYLFSWIKEGRLWRIEGIKNNNVVKEITIGSVTKRILRAASSSNTLQLGDTYDVTRIVVSEVDEYENVLTLSDEVIEITTNTYLSVIGPPVISLTKGVAAFYVKTHKKKGKGIITIKNQQKQKVEVHIEIT
jgi:beta-galactosidase